MAHGCTQSNIGLEIQEAVAIVRLSPHLHPLSVSLLLRVTLYAEFLPMKARAKCILLIEVRVAGFLESSVSGMRFSGVLSQRARKRELEKKI